MNLKSALYKALKYSNDINAVQKNRVPRRIGRRLYGKGHRPISSEDIPMTRTTTIPTWLAVAIVALGAATAGVFAAALLGIMPGGGNDKLEDQPGYEEAHTEAQYYCTLAGVVPGMTSLYDPEYLACVEEQTKSNLESGDYN